MAGLLTLAISSVACLSSSPPDGQLDCTTDVTWIGSAEPDQDTVGSDTPEQAIQTALKPYRDHHGGEVVFVSDTQGSLVVDGVEAVIVHASRSPAGGWVVNTSTGCERYTT
jgi:hypothetical protein